MAGGSSSAWALGIQLKQGDILWQLISEGKLHEAQGLLNAMQATGTEDDVEPPEPGQPE